MIKNIYGFSERLFFIIAFIIMSILSFNYSAVMKEKNEMYIHHNESPIIMIIFNILLAAFALYHIIEFIELVFRKKKLIIYKLETKRFVLHFIVVIVSLFRFLFHAFINYENANEFSNYRIHYNYFIIEIRYSLISALLLFIYMIFLILDRFLGITKENKKIG